MNGGRRLLVVSVAVTCGLSLGLAAPASARKFQMSGTWVMRNGQVFIPLQFAATVMNGSDVLPRRWATSPGRWASPTAPSLARAA